MGHSRNRIIAPKSSVSAPSTGKLPPGVRWRTAKPRMQTRSQKASRPPPTPPARACWWLSRSGRASQQSGQRGVLELPHDPHVFAPDLTRLKGRSGAGQYGRQHLTGHRPSGCRPVSISDPAPRRPLLTCNRPDKRSACEVPASSTGEAWVVTAGINRSPQHPNRIHVRTLIPPIGTQPCPETAVTEVN